MAIFSGILHHGSDGTLGHYRLRSVIFNPVSIDTLYGHLPRSKFVAGPGSFPNQQRHARHKCKPDSSGPGKLATHENNRSIYQRPQELPPAGTSVLRADIMSSISALLRPCRAASSCHFATTLPASEIILRARRIQIEMPRYL